MKLFSTKKTFIVILIILISIVLVLFVIKLLLYSNKKISPSANTSVSTNNVSVEPYPDFTLIGDTNLPSLPSGWSAGDNEKYTILFPTSMRPTTIAVDGGGTNTIFNPVTPPTPGHTEYPEFTIEEYPTDPTTSIQDRIDQIKKLTPDNFTQEKTTFRGLPATQVSEILPIQDNSGNKLSKTFLFFTNNSTTYLVDFAYFQDANATGNQQMLLQMVSSIRLK